MPVAYFTARALGRPLLVVLVATAEEARHARGFHGEALPEIQSSMRFYNNKSYKVDKFVAG